MSVQGRSSGWNLLRNTADWNRYQVMVCESNSMDVHSVGWGKCPEQYPCLATAYVVNPAKIVACYVYPGDATYLLTAGGLVREAAMADHAKPVAKAPPAQAQNADVTESIKCLTAHMLVATELMIDTGIVKQDEYERRYQARLAGVDQYQSERRATLDKSTEES